MKARIAFGLVTTLFALNAGAGYIDSSNDNDYSLVLSGDKNSRSYDAGLKIWSRGFEPVWHWDDMSMTIDGATGNASVSGVMQYLGNSRSSAYFRDSWDFNMNLSGFKTTDSWPGYHGRFGHDAFNELLSSANSSDYQRYDLDIGWAHADMTIGNDSKGLWMSFDGKHNGSGVSAELEFNSYTGLLQFGAWYHNSKWCLTGDSLVTATYLEPGHPPVDVPEPASLVLIGVGVLGLITIRRRKL